MNSISRTIKFSLKKHFTHHGFWCAVLIITFAGCVAWQMSTWYFSDDYVYMHPVNNENAFDYFWLCGNNTSYTPEVAVSSSIAHWKYINGRLANILYIWAQLVPRQLVNFLNGVMMALMFWLMTRFAVNRAANLRRRCFVAVSLLCFWLMLPWHDTMQSSVYQFNYTWTTVGVLASIYLFNRKNQSDAKSASWLTILGCSLLAFFSGWMHEGISECMLAYFGISFVFYSRYRNRFSFFMLLAGLAGWIMAVSPGTLDRLNSSHSGDFSLLTYWISRFVRELWPVYISLISASIAIIKIRSRVEKLNFLRNLVPYLVAEFTGLVLAVVILCTGRVLWGCNLFAAIITIRSFSVICQNKKEAKSSIFLSTIIIVVYVAWLASLVWWQNVIASEQRIFDKELASQNKASIYYHNIHHNNDLPFWLRDMVAHQFSYHSMSNMTQSLSISDSRHHFFSILPDSLAAREYENLPAIPGRNPFRGVADEMLSDTLFSHPVGIMRFGAPQRNYSPLQALQAFMKNGTNPYYSTDSCRVAFTMFGVTDSSGRLLVKYEPSELPLSVLNREVVSVDLVDYKHVVEPFDIDSILVYSLWDR